MSLFAPVARLSIAAVTSALLVVTVLTPVAASAAPVDPGLVLPATDSTPAEAVTPTIPAGDFGRDIAQPSALSTEAVISQLKRRPADVPLSSLDLRSLPVTARNEFSTTYDGPGSKTIVALGYAPLNVKVDGKWVEIETGMSLNSSGWAEKAHPLSPQFSRTSGGEVVTMTSDGSTLSWELLGTADDVAPIRAHRTANTVL